MQNKSKDSSCDKVPSKLVHIGESVSDVGGYSPSEVPCLVVWGGGGGGLGVVQVKTQCIFVMHEFIPKRIHQTHTG